MPSLPVIYLLSCPLPQPNRRLLSFILSFCVTIVSTTGQEAPLYSVRYLGLKEGLSSRDVKDIYRDNRGMVWIATAFGLNRYDGREMTIYSDFVTSPVRLPSSYIRNIAEDDAQNLLLCTDVGLVALDPSRRRLAPLRQLGFPDSVSRQINCRTERLPGGKLLLLSGAVIYRYERGQLTEWFRLPPEYVPTINLMCYSNKDSTLYLRTNSLDYGLLAIRDKRLTSLNYLVQRDGASDNNLPFSFAKLSTGMLNSLGDSMTLYQQEGVGFRLHIDRMTKQFIRKQGEQFSDVFPPWQAVQQYLSKLDEATLPGSMRRGTLKFCLKDDQDIYWMGTNVGVFVARETRKSAFRQFDFLKNISIRSIVQDEAGNLLIGTYAGLFKYDPNRGQLLKMSAIKTVLDMAPVGNDRYWMAMEGWEGLCLFDNHVNRINSFPTRAPALSFVYDFAQTDSTIWMAPSIEQVYCLHIADGRTVFQTPLKPYRLSLRKTLVKSILAAKDGCIWIGSEAGLYRLIPEKKGKWVQDTASVSPLLRKIKINTLYEDRSGRLWIGTDGQGLAVLSPGSGKLQWYSPNDGLAHNVVYGILGSHRDSLLWVGTQNGLSSLHSVTGVFNNYHQEDGLADNEFNTGARYQANDGSLYFGGINGITYFNPKQLTVSPQRLKTSLAIHMPNAAEEDAPIQWLPLNKETLLIPASETYLEIQFSSNSIFEADHVLYRYTISGLYDSWQYSDAASKLILRSLSPGRYHLKVQTLTPFGRWGGPFEVTIHLLPHYYQTWWFRALMALLIAGALYGIYRFRVWQMQREYAIRNRIVNDLHDDFGSRLFAMRVMASKIASPKTKAADLETLFAQFEATSKNAYEAMRDFIWAFDPKNDRLEDLTDRMFDFAKNTIRPLVDELKIGNNITSLNAAVEPIVKHNALMIFQEILTNLSKHTFVNFLKIDFSEENHFLCIYILNKHSGLRDTNPDSGQKGKISIEARLRAIKGQLEWNEQTEQQEIILRIPF